MPVIELETTIAAPIQRCFDLARSIDLHVDSMRHTGERAVAGRTSGLIELGESVTWEAKHLGVRQRLTSRITAFEPHTYFQDTMTDGAFASFVHDHFFRSSGPGETVMRDVVAFRSPLGVVGQAVDQLIIKRYLAKLLSGRQLAVKNAAERNTA